MSFRKRSYKRRRFAGSAQPPRLGHIRPPYANEVLDEVMRIVHTQRARKLRRRGVELQLLEPGVYVWFEHPESFLNRRMQRALVDTMRKGARERLSYIERAWPIFKEYGRRWLAARDKLGETLRQFSIQTATGHALDVVAGLYAGRPHGLTDEDVRAYVRQGYVVKVDESPVAPGESPRVTLFSQGDYVIGGPDDSVDMAAFTARYGFPNE